MQSNGQSIQKMLRQWYEEPLGRTLHENEQARVDLALADLFGYHIVQLGRLHEETLLDRSKISHKIVLELEEDGPAGCKTDLISTGESLALASDSIDVIFMLHVLEYAANPHKLLREVERVLRGDGHVVIVGFNPWSFWGIWRFFLVWREVPPWCGHFYGLARLKDWLTLLDLELVRIERFFFRPPLKNVRLMNKINFLEKLGKYWWNWFGGVYIITAKKRVIPLTPIKMQWRDKQRVINSGIAEPSTRTSRL